MITSIIIYIEGQKHKSITCKTHVCPKSTGWRNWITTTQKTPLRTLSMAALSRRRARREGYSDSESEEQTRRRLLPARSSRGTRINKLIGEEAEADEAFWGQDAWQEDASDDDYSTEEGAVLCGKRL